MSDAITEMAEAFTGSVARKNAIEGEIQGSAQLSHIVFDVSDLVFYIGHHANLSGIQRVQSRIIAATKEMASQSRVSFISWNRYVGYFELLDSEFLHKLLEDLAHCPEERTVYFDPEAAKLGYLPGSIAFSVHHQHEHAISIVLLGAAWVQEDYFRHLLALKRALAASFFCVIHDLIPIYARETCDQGTADVFNAFLLSSAGVVDVYICVSQHTRSDLLTYFRENNLPPPEAIVITSGTDEVNESLLRFMEERKPGVGSAPPSRDYVLFVSTIEGRKNHALAFKTWRRLSLEFENPPLLICVGRYGWRSEEFLRSLVTTGNLGGLIEVRSEISDAELELLYKNCLFTIYPSFYEGWGLPITESLARGKPCICSSTSSMPEAGGDLAIYINPHDADDLYNEVLCLLNDRDELTALQNRIVERHQRRAWADVASDYITKVSSYRQTLKPKLYVTVSGGAEYPLRSAPLSFDNKLGDELFRSVRNSFSGALLGRPCQLVHFIDGQNLRGAGDWKPLESWGTWIGVRGGTLCFWSNDADPSMKCYVRYRVLPCFLGREVKYLVNRQPAVRRAQSAGGFDTHCFEIDLRAGLNTVHVAMDLLEEDIERSNGVDKRGLMYAIASVAFVKSSDVSSRLIMVESRLEELFRVLRHDGG